MTAEVKKGEDKVGLWSLSVWAASILTRWYVNVTFPEGQGRVDVPRCFHACRRKQPLRLHACTKNNKTRQLINAELIIGNKYFWWSDQEW